MDQNDIFKRLLKLLDEGKSAVLATLIRTKGSTPQKPGARLIFTEEGKSFGTLGGGCVEADVIHWAKELLAASRTPLYRKYHLNADLAARDGLVCGGSMYFFIDPFIPGSSNHALLKTIVQLLDSNKSAVLATIIEAPHTEWVGKKMVLSEGGLWEGDWPSELKWDSIIPADMLTRSFGGLEIVAPSEELAVCVETLVAAPLLILMGGGHVNRALAQFAGSLGFRIVVADDRPEFANRERFPRAQQILVGDYSDILQQIRVPANSFIIIATRGHKFDEDATRAAAQTPAGYIGLLGSKRKCILIAERLLESGISPERLQHIHGPVGLDIGARTPEEIALSILSEIILMRQGGTGKPLSIFSEDWIRKIANKHDRE